MYQKNYSEYQNIKRSVVVLSLSLVLVYIVLYYAKWDLWEEELEINHLVYNTWEISISELDTQNWSNDEIVDQYLSWDNTKKDDLDLVEPNNLTWDLEITSNRDTSEEIENNSDEVLSFVLSGTKTYYWELDFVEKLWISYDYALKDDKNIYYLNMWNYDYDFSDIVRKLWWSLYVMNTEQEIIANSMFGEKVTYINIPEYKNNKVLLLLTLDSQSWLLAIDYSIYHQVKPYLKNLFID